MYQQLALQLSVSSCRTAEVNQFLRPSCEVVYILECLYHKAGFDQSVKNGYLLMLV